MVNTLQDQLAARDRMDALSATELMDSDPEPQFDRITRLICNLLGADVSLISLVDDRRQFFKSSCGLPEQVAAERGTPLSHSFCQHVVASGEPLIVSNAHEDPLIASNLAVRDLDVIAYLGVPIRDAEGHVLGSLCAIQSSPRDWSDQDRAAMQDFGRIVEAEISQRGRTKAAIDDARNSETLAREYNHRAKNTLALAVSLLNLSAREASSVEALTESMRARLKALANAHDALLSDRGRAQLFDLLSRLLLPYETRDRPLELSGPPVDLEPRQVTALCLALHELATNSAKYGALVNGGRLSVTWAADGKSIELFWTEETGSRPFDAGQHAGFGSKLLNATARQLDGEISHRWEGSVFHWSLRFPAALDGGTR